MIKDNRGSIYVYNRHTYKMFQTKMCLMKDDDTCFWIVLEFWKCFLSVSIIGYITSSVQLLSNIPFISPACMDTRDSIIDSCWTSKWQGVTVNNGLSPGDHIKHAIKNYNTNLYIILSIYISTDNGKLFYKAYFLIHIRFDIWCAIGGDFTHKLEEIHN